MAVLGNIRAELGADKQANLAAKGVEPQDITLGVRPNHILLNNGVNGNKAVVDVSEMMGSEVHLHANADGKDVVIIVPTMDANGNHQGTFAHGDEIHFTFGGNVCHVFDAEGKNLEF